MKPASPSGIPIHTICKMQHMLCKFGAKRPTTWRLKLLTNETKNAVFHCKLLCSIEVLCPFRSLNLRLLWFEPGFVCSFESRFKPKSSGVSKRTREKPIFEQSCMCIVATVAVTVASYCCSHSILLFSFHLFVSL